MKIKANILILTFIICIGSVSVIAQKPLELAEKMSQTAMRLWPDSFVLKPGKPVKWSYDQGVILKGMENVWKLTGNGQYFSYLQQCMDFYVGDNGKIKYYKPEEFNIDNLNNGRILLLLHAITGKEKYKKATQLLFSQIQQHPRTKEGSFWHKQIYPNQVWLDGLYMAQPFYAEYANRYAADSLFDDIVRQFLLIETHTRNPKTGLLVHGWDESKEQQWADKNTGCSPLVWGRAMGWYGMALVDVLDYLPANHPGRKQLLAVLQRFVSAISKYQDPASGTWYDIVDMPKEKGNYKEASASCMFTYVIAKSLRKGYIAATYNATLQKAFKGICTQFIKTEADGAVTLTGTVSVSGLGGKPYRDGSFAYYMSEPVIDNDPKGIGAFILCCTEVERWQAPKNGKGKRVVMDNYFNNEWRKNGFGVNMRRHYTWDDFENGGFSLWGELWEYTGAKLSAEAAKPTAANLKNADILVIVDPDGWKDTKTPNYMDDTAANALAAWVKKGGVLLLMTNDSSNCDLAHFNLLSEKFGMHFNNKSLNMVKDNHFEEGAVNIEKGNQVFTNARTVYLKEICSIDISAPAKSLLVKEGETVMATANYGKGKVLAVCDPWLYNEYLDGRKIPATFENYRASRELINWLLKQTIKK